MSKAIVSFYTSAAKEYDGFSTETLATVGIDNRSGNPVRQVECQRRDYEWQSQRYSSGLCRYTSERVTLQDYERFGDWSIDHTMLDRPAKPKGRKPAYVAQIEAERDFARQALEELQTRVNDLAAYLMSDKFITGDPTDRVVHVNDVLNRLKGL